MRLLPLLLPLLALPLTQAKVEVSAQHLHAVLHANTAEQALLRVCLNSDSKGKILSALRFKIKGGEAIKSFKIYQSGAEGSCPLFSTRTERATEKSSPTKLRVKRTQSTATFTGRLKLKEGNNYIWLVAETTKGALGNTPIDAELIQIKTSDKDTTITQGNPEGHARIYPFEQRIIPYYRSMKLVKWSPDQLKEADFKRITDIIYFNLKCDGSGNLLGGDDPIFLEGIAKLKKLRGKEPVEIMLGIAGCDEGFTGTAASAEARRNFAQQVKSYLDTHGFDGIDLDWEYPDTTQQWVDFAYLVNALREELGGSNKSITSAVNLGYRAPNKLALDVLDYANIMCYDRGGEHSTMAHFKEDLARARAQMPEHKIIMGLPYYTNEIDANRNWGAQAGYVDVVKNEPRLTANDNHTTLKGKAHYFNGAKLIADKSRIARAEKIGGVMIWAYECDIPETHKLSLRKAMFGEIKRSARPSYTPPAPATKAGAPKAQP